MAEKEPKTVKADDTRDDESREKPAKDKQIPLMVLILGILVMLVTPVTSFFLVKMAMPKPEAATEESASGEGHTKEGKSEGAKKEGHGEGAKKEGAKKEGAKKEGHGKSEGAAKEGKKGEAVAEQDATTFTLPFMLINIAETKGTRILKITPHLILSEPEMGAKMPALKPLLMDTITTVASGKTLDELDGPAGRENLKRAIIQRLNKLLETRMTGAVADVYFEEFLIN